MINRGEHTLVSEHVTYWIRDVGIAWTMSKNVFRRSAGPNSQEYMGYDVVGQFSAGVSFPSWQQSSRFSNRNTELAVFLSGLTTTQSSKTIVPKSSRSGAVHIYTRCLRICVDRIVRIWQLTSSIVSCRSPNLKTASQRVLYPWSSPGSVTSKMSWYDLVSCQETKKIMGDDLENVFVIQNPGYDGRKVFFDNLSILSQNGLGPIQVAANTKRQRSYLYLRF